MNAAMPSRSNAMHRYAPARLDVTGLMLGTLPFELQIAVLPGQAVPAVLLAKAICRQAIEATRNRAGCNANFRSKASASCMLDSICHIRQTECCHES